MLVLWARSTGPFAISPCFHSSNSELPVVPSDCDWFASGCLPMWCSFSLKWLFCGLKWHILCIMKLFLILQSLTPPVSLPDCSFFSANLSFNTLICLLYFIVILLYNLCFTEELPYLCLYLVWRWHLGSVNFCLKEKL